MVNNLLEAGLTGLANTRKVHGDQWFHGHHGAAVLAAHFISQDFDLSEEVQSLVTHFAQQTMARHPDLFRCEQGDTSLVGVDSLVTQLGANIDALSADGHDVIFASLALRALQQRPDLATAKTISAIIELLRATELDNPQRYYGYSNYLQDKVDLQNVPEFDHVDAAVTFALAHHDIVYPDQAINGKYYFLAGSKLHVVTHVHALKELHSMGYGQLVKRGLQALRKQIHLTDVSRLSEPLQAHEPNELLDPRTTAFWARDKTDAHQIKLAHAVLSLLGETPSTTHQSTLHNMSKYWSLLP